MTAIAKMTCRARRIRLRRTMGKGVLDLMVEEGAALKRLKAMSYFEDGYGNDLAVLMESRVR